MPTLIESGRVDQAEAQVQRPDGDAWPSSLARENIATLRPNTAWRHRRAATAIALMRATPDPSSALAVDQRRRVAFRLLVSLLCLNSREEVDRVLAAHGAVGWPARQVRVDVALAMNAGDCPRAKRLRRVTWVTWVALAPGETGAWPAQESLAWLQGQAPRLQVLLTAAC